MLPKLRDILEAARCSILDCGVYEEHKKRETFKFKSGA